MEKVISSTVQRENVGYFLVRELVGRILEWQLSLTSARDKLRGACASPSQLLTWIAIRLQFHSSILRYNILSDYHSAGLACGY